MTWVDLAVFGLLGISGLLAFVRGFVREVLGIGAWIGAIAAGVAGVPFMRGYVRAWLQAPEWINPASFFVVFVITLIILMLTARAIGSLVRGSALGGVDRTLGLVFGLGRGAVIVMIAYILGGMVFPIDHWPEAVLNARTLPLAYQGARRLRDQLPENYRPRIYAPPVGREATADDLLRASPQGRATGKPLARD
ncbi:CvpA family protein [Rhodopila sp.]|uniref:CvpA family protein n=1 Tax=Rhodopila sp. TaxID=2480087 RepID=UPI003D0F826E